MDGPNHRAVKLVAAALALGAFACARAAPVPPPTAPPEPPPCERIVEIEVRKAAHTLVARCERGAVVTMAIALGREPTGTKQRQGDYRTPEGDYRVAGPERESRFHRFIPIDYPSVADAEAARIDGRLAEPDYARILDAHARGALPPADTPLGGGIGLHGEGSRWQGESAGLDWTYGCVAVTDEEIDFLARRVAPGTPVRVLP